jgi:hypothetical protein
LSAASNNGLQRDKQREIIMIKAQKSHFIARALINVAADEIEYSAAEGMIFDIRTKRDAFATKKDRMSKLSQLGAFGLNEAGFDKMLELAGAEIETRKASRRALAKYRHDKQKAALAEMREEAAYA